MHFTNEECILWNELADSRSELRRKSWLIKLSTFLLCSIFCISFFRGLVVEETPVGPDTQVGLRPHVDDCSTSCVVNDCKICYPAPYIYITLRERSFLLKRWL